MAWYRRAATAGDAVAQFFLAQCLFEGDGVSQDRAEAVSWMQRASAARRTHVGDALEGITMTGLDGNVLTGAQFMAMAIAPKYM